MFDTFLDADGTEYQTKAFGKTLAYFRVGSPAPVRRAPVTEAEHNAWLDNTWDGDPGPGADTCQVEAEDGVLLTIRDGVFVGTSRTRDPQVPLFDYYGRNVTDLAARLEDPTFQARYRQAATLAWSHRSAIAGAYQDTSLAEEYNAAVAALIVHCDDLDLEVPEVHEPTAYAAYLEESRRAEQRRREEEQAELAAAGFADFNWAKATPEEEAAYLAFVAQSKHAPTWEKELLSDGPRSRRDRSPLDDLPRSRFVIGYPEPQRPETPMALQDIADVFMRALAVLRDDRGAEPEAGQRRSIPGPRIYHQHVEEYRNAGLHVVGPGWASTARVHQSS